MLVLVLQVDSFEKIAIPVENEVFTVDRDELDYH